MKHSISYDLAINERSKESLIKECQKQIEVLDTKFGKGIGAQKERTKLQERIDKINAWNKQDYIDGKIWY